MYALNNTAIMTANVATNFQIEIGEPPAPVADISILSGTVAASVPVPVPSVVPPAVRFVNRFVFFRWNDNFKLRNRGLLLFKSNAGVVPPSRSAVEPLVSIARNEGEGEEGEEDEEDKEDSENSRSEESDMLLEEDVFLSDVDVV